MKELREALETIKKECNSHNYCDTCPLFVEDDYVGNYCSVTREEEVPAKWNVESMTK